MFLLVIGIIQIVNNSLVLPLFRSSEYERKGYGLFGKAEKFINYID